MKILAPIRFRSTSFRPSDFDLDCNGSCGPVEKSVVRWFGVGSQIAFSLDHLTSEVNGIDPPIAKGSMICAPKSSHFVQITITTMDMLTK